MTLSMMILKYQTIKYFDDFNLQEEVHLPENQGKFDIFICLLTVACVIIT